MPRFHQYQLLFAIMVTLAPQFCHMAAAQNAGEFPAPYDSQETKTPITSAAAALEAIQLPNGFRATLFAAEPAVRQPIAMATDHCGRLWVAENYTYAQQDVNFDERLRDRIIVLEDNDEDGHFDQRKVFWDQASKLTSVEIGFGGVWALCPPYLLFLPDRDGDCLIDGEPEVVLDGWDDDAVRHNIANGLRWGPDGWLYGRHGILATSHVGVPGTPPDQRSKINCGVWRLHPVRRTFEVVCTGTTNPWGMDWDQHGHLFFINTVIGHLWHVVPGAHFQRMYGEDFNPYLYELLPQSADHFHWDTVEAWSDIRKIGVTKTTDAAGGGHAHSGMMIYQGGLWPPRYHNSLFTVNLHGRRLNNDSLVRVGSGYVGKHQADFLFTSDPWFRGVEVMSSPDGNLFLADWSDIGECHENDGVHRGSGRIFKIAFGNEPTGAAPQKEPTFYDLSTATSALLVANQVRRNEWLVRQSRRLLQERAAAGLDMRRVHEQLHELFNERPNDTHRLRAMWALYATGGVSPSWLIERLNDESEHVRCWAILLLCDTGELPEAARLALKDHLHAEKSGLVLQHVAAALLRMPPAERFALAAQIASHAEFGDDPRLPLLVWHAIEPAVIEHREAAIELAVSTRMPKLRQFIARRVTTEIERYPDSVAQLVDALNSSDDEFLHRHILEGMSEALRGWRRAPKPGGWEKVIARLQGNNEIQRIVRELSVVFGDGRALAELQEIAASATADLESRRSALRSLTAVKADRVVQLLQNLMNERDLQVDAIRGLAAFNDPKTAQLLVDNYRRLRPQGQNEAMNTLVSRPAYAQVLISAVEKGTLPREIVSPFHVRQMHTFGDDSLNQRISSVWPELQQHAAEKSQRIAQYRDQLTPERLAAANLANGRALFQRSCANCHVLFGEGGKIGPDLTGGQRSNLTYLLENIVDPSATVSENFRMSIVIVNDGRVINGILSEKTDKTVTVLTPTDRIVLANDEIEEIRPANLSIMPEGQLDVLKSDQVRDLIAYLMADAQK